MNVEELNPHGHELTGILEFNLNKLADVVTALSKESMLLMRVTSGLRTKEEQMRINPMAPNSCHTYGLAVDLEDTHGSIFNWLIEHPDFMNKYDIYLEDRTYCRNWVHIQISPPKSRNRVFRPF